jgi:Astacin (Peptidase family M12A)
MNPDTETMSAETPYYCAQPFVPEPVLVNDGNVARARLILTTAQKWANGSTLKYYFFNRPTDGSDVQTAQGKVFMSYVAPDDRYVDVVRKAFKKWKDIGIGLRFEEVQDRNDAHIRISFQQTGSSWSYLGRQVLGFGPNKPTMNFGWPLTSSHNGEDTALHEIGHTLGFPHEHQNPYAGIVWDEEKVYADLGGPPNNWSRETTRWNILRKIDPDEVQGSSWDPDSVMHYPFGRNLIREPAGYRNGLNPRGGLSARDKQWVKTFYPPIALQEVIPLAPLQSHELVGELPSSQTFSIEPEETKTYEIRTLGDADTLLVLFEENDGESIQLAADDDSGGDRNASIKAPLVKGRKYRLEARLNYASGPKKSAVVLI